MMQRVTSKLAAFAVVTIPAAAFAMEEGYAPDAASHGDASHHGEAASTGLPQFDPSTFAGQIFWLAVTFVVLYTIFAGKILPAVGSTIESRRTHIENDITSAESLRANAADAQKTYEDMLNSARTESARLLNEAISETKGHAERKIKELHERSMQKIELTGKRLEENKHKARGEMSTIAAEIASEAAARIVGMKPDITQAQTVVQSLNNKREAA